MRKSSQCHNLYIVTPDIGEGFRPFHAFSTIVYAKSIGRNFCVFQNVTIGFNNGKNPTIGDNVTVFAGANVLGGKDWRQCCNRRRWRCFKRYSFKYNGCKCKY